MHACMLHTACNLNIFIARTFRVHARMHAHAHTHPSIYAYAYKRVYLYNHTV